MTCGLGNRRSIQLSYGAVEGSYSRARPRSERSYWISPRIYPALHAAVWTFTYAPLPALSAATNEGKSGGAPAAAT